ncbi:MAG: nucleotidyltransferase domain-containing protein [archaeon]
MNTKKVDITIQKSGQMKKEIGLLLPFIKEPWKSFTLSEIKEIAKNKSHHYVYDALVKFSKKKVIYSEKKGNTNLYTLNEKASFLDYYIMAELLVKEKSIQIPIDVINQILDKIKDAYFTLIVTGSYANNNQKKDSDLDVAIIIPNDKNKKPFQIALKEGELTIPEVHGFVFTEEEFYQMLVNKEYNYGKEFAKNHVIIYGADSYYKILLRGLQNGFKG